MATYLYEVVGETNEAPPETFEVRQSMLDAPLSHHPESGKPVRRVLVGGFGLMKVRSGSTTFPEAGTGTGGHTANCCPGCHD